MSVSIPKSIEAFLKTASAAPEFEVPFTLPETRTTHKLTLRRARAKNFRSIGNEFLEIDYQRNQSTLITSDDNGAGKSTLAVWIPFFVLYNTPYSKKEVKSGLLNSTTRKDCVAEMELFSKGVEWKISRGIKPDFIKVSYYDEEVKGWKELQNEAGVNNTDKLIENIIGLDRKMFENMVILGKDKYEPFIEMSAGERRHVIENIWDLGIFSIMNEEAKDDLKRTNVSLSEKSKERDIVSTKLESARLVYQQTVQSNALINSNNQETHDNLVKEVDAASVSLAEQETIVEGKKEEIVELNNKIKTNFDDVEKQMDAKLASVKETFKQKIENLEKTFVGSFQHNKEKGEKVQLQLDEAKEKLAFIRVEIDDYKKVQKELLEKSRDASNKINQGKVFLAKFETELASLQKIIDDFNNMCECPTCTQTVSEETKIRITNETRQKIFDVNAKIQKVAEQIKVLETDVSVYNNKHDDIEEIELRMEVENEQRVLETIQQLTDALNVINQDKKDIENKLAHESEIIRNEQRSEIKAAAEWGRTQTELQNSNLCSKRESAQEILDSAQQRCIALQNEITTKRQTIARLASELQKSPVDTTPYEKQIADLEQELGGLEDIVKELNMKAQDIEHVLYFLKDDQTKSRIISEYLPFLNGKVNEYLEGLNIFVGVNIDDKFNIKLTSPERKGQTLFSLSDGQRARLNLAITYALSDVANLKASVQCNVLVMDEILENMSERGVQEAVEMLKLKFPDKNVFVISQREQEFKEYFPHNIRYGLRNGFTTVIN